MSEFAAYQTFVPVGLLTSGLCFSLSWFMYMNDWFRVCIFSVSVHI